MKMIMELTTDFRGNFYWSLELLKNDKVIELCKRESLIDAELDLRWYLENEYPEATFKGVRV